MLARLLYLFFVLLMFSGGAQAARNINSVLVDGGTTTTVEGGETVNVEITVTTTGFGFAAFWVGTSYILDGSTQCLFTGLFFGAGTHTSSFNITAPATDGNYDLEFYAHPDFFCAFGSSAPYNLPGAIVVGETDPEVDHYSITHSGTGITCEAETVTVIAHDSSHNPVNLGDNVVLTSSNPATAITAISSDATSATYAVSLTTPGTIDLDVSDDDGITDLDGSAEDPALTFVDTALRFNSDGSLSSPTTAGSTSPSQLLRAIRTDSNTGACTAAIAGSQIVQMAYECVNPSSCVRDRDLDIGATSIEDNPSGIVVDYAPVTLTFSASGEAPFTFNYKDVGEFRLHASTTLAAVGDDPAITLSGSSSSAISRPADLVVTEVETLAAVINPEASDEDGDAFVTAGDNFRVTVESRNTLGAITPNFGNESSPENVSLSFDSLVLPSTGGSNGTLNGSGFSPTATPGELQSNSVSWTEVGIMRVNAEIADGNYLGTGNVVGSASANIGRFTPSQFTVSTPALSESTGCVGPLPYTYIGHNFSGSFTLVAQNSLGSTTTNYAGTLAKLDQTSGSIAVGGLVGATDVSSRLTGTVSSTAAPTWINGSASITADLLMARLSNDAEGPHNVTVGVDAEDSDGVSIAPGLFDLDPDGTGNSLYTLGTSNQRFGRLQVEDTFGPESSSLEVDFLTEHWNGSLFVPNTDDSCTQIAPVHIAFDSEPISINLQAPVGGSSTTGNFAVYDVIDGAEAVAGNFGLNFSAPNATGSFDIDVDLTGYPWLQFDWNQDNVVNDAAIPPAEVTFGTYRGNDRVIYWREVYQ